MLVGYSPLFEIMLVCPGHRKMRNRSQSLTSFNIGRLSEMLNKLTIKAFTASSRWLKFTSQTLLSIPGSLGAA